MQDAVQKVGPTPSYILHLWVRLCPSRVHTRPCSNLFFGTTRSKRFLEVHTLRCHYSSSIEQSQCLQMFGQPASMRKTAQDSFYSSEQPPGNANISESSSNQISRPCYISSRGVCCKTDRILQSFSNQYLSGKHFVKSIANISGLWSCQA